MAAVTLTTGELLSLLSVGVAIGGFAFTVWRYVEGKIAAVRAEAEKLVADCRATHAAEVARIDGRVEATRAECARREDLQAISASLHRIGERFDDGMTVMHRRIDDLMKGGRGREAGDD